MFELIGTNPRGIFRFVSGWPAVALVFVYSFLTAAVLPLPSEFVLFVPLGLGLSPVMHYTVIILVSSVGKAMGSLLALELGRTATDNGSRFLGGYGVSLNNWLEERTLALARRYGYLGLTAMLSIPAAPDTVSIYAFSVLEEDPRRFAVATFFGSIFRLLITLFLVRGVGILFRLV